MAAAGTDDWQANKTLAETNRYMWENKIECDVTFHVGDRGVKISAHRYILISRSGMFYTMFRGSLPVDSTKPIHVPDVQPDIFKQLLGYMYTDTIHITLDNVLALLHAAKIYMVPAVVGKCRQKLKGKMLTTNLCMIMEAAHVFIEKELWEMCRTGILRNPKQVFPRESLAELCSDCLESLLEDDKLRMEEEELFECVLKYSQQKCLKKMLPVTPEYQRLVLGKALQQIRFPLMNKEYFSDRVEPLELLTPSESKSVLKFFLKPESAAPLPFKTLPRDLHKIVLRFQRHDAGWTYSYRNLTDAITCQCTEDIQLHGVLIYGSCDGPKEFDAKITILETNKAPKVMQVFKTKSDGHTKYYECLFTNPVQIIRYRQFIIMLEMKSGKNTFCGENGLENVEQNGITFKFTRSDLSMNNTNTSRGQIPGLIYSAQCGRTEHTAQ